MIRLQITNYKLQMKKVKLHSYALTLLRFLILILFFFLTFGCVKDKNPIPNVYVNFYVYPNDIFYLDLNYYGGSMYFTGGVNGVVVYRLGEMEFTAFDRACPHDWEDSEAYIVVESDGITLSCRKCGTLYNILDGGIILGPSKYPLKPYFTKFDGMRLRVHS